jgi:hypothetical protein
VGKQLVEPPPLAALLVDGRAVDLAETPFSRAIAALADHVRRHVFGFAGATRRPVSHPDSGARRAVCNLGNPSVS